MIFLSEAGHCTIFEPGIWKLFSRTHWMNIHHRTVFSDSEKIVSVIFSVTGAPHNGSHRPFGRHELHSHAYFERPRDFIGIQKELERHLKMGLMINLRNAKKLNETILWTFFRACYSNPETTGTSWIYFWWKVKKKISEYQHENAHYDLFW